MEHKILMPLDIQLFAEGGEEEKANNQDQVDNTSKETKVDGKKETNSDEKKYSDKELNDISFKNEQKALAKQLKDLGIDDVEKAKSILAKAREEEEKSKSVDEKTQEAIKKVTGFTPTLFRPTYGGYTNALKSYTDLKFVLWDVDSRDWQVKSKDKILKNILPNVKSGSIILMRLDAQVKKELPLMITYLKQKGYEIVNLEQLLEE